MKNLTIIFCIIFLCSCTEEYYYNKALDYEEAGDYKQAIEYLDKVILKNPQRIWAYVNRAADKRELSDYEGAIEDYTKAIGIDTTLVAGYMGRAQVYMKLKDYSSALVNFNNAATKSGVTETNNKIIAFSRGNAPIQNVFTKYEEPFYPATEILFERGVAYFFSDSSNLALRDLAFCLSNEISLEMKRDCHYWIGHIYLKAGYRKEGCTELKAAINLGDSDAEKEYDYYCGDN